MYDIKQCQKVVIGQGIFYLGESTEEKSVGYLELRPHTSLTIHNRVGGIENLTQVNGECVMIVFDTLNGTNHHLKKGDELKLIPEAVWHIHSNLFNDTSLTYWHFNGNIRKIIEEIRNGVE
jgi:hypothetical protein